jgi:tetratricopeptide (TPR) repeat protein
MIIEGPPKYSARLERLLGFIERDPNNLALLDDAAAQALDDGAPQIASDLLTRRAVIAPPPARILNLEGLAALAQQRHEDAARIFTALKEQGEQDPALRFNLAWALAMLNRYAEALALLDDAVIAASPRGPKLKIHMMHHLAQYDEALAEGARLAALYPSDTALLGALATLAMDAERADLALDYAKRAGDDPEGRAVIGMLALGEQDLKTSLAAFDAALARQPRSPRAWVGKGLGLLAGGDVAAGTEAIDRGAELFGDHIGSWIAAGWAHYTAGDIAKAKARFERALAIDPNFAESHGALAVIAIAEGRLEDARRSCDIALRLDRNCFGGALAKSMLLDQAGHAQAAQKIRDIAMAAPVGPKGETLLQMLAGMGKR